MEKKTYKFGTDKRRIFYYFVNIMNPFLKLSTRETQVLSELLFYNNEMKSYSDHVKWKMVFDKDARIKIQEDLKISTYQFNNILTSLRKKNIIVKNRVVNELLIYPDSGLLMQFTFMKNEPQSAN